MIMGLVQDYSSRQQRPKSIYLKPKDFSTSFKSCKQVRWELHFSIGGCSVIEVPNITTLHLFQRNLYGLQNSLFQSDTSCRAEILSLLKPIIFTLFRNCTTSRSFLFVGIRIQGSSVSSCSDKKFQTRSENKKPLLGF